MPNYWMISNRTVEADDFGSDLASELTYWTSDKGPLNTFNNWTQRSADDFKSDLIKAADQFPPLDHSENEEQCHVSFFVHGYNNGWQDAAKRYQKFCTSLFSGKDSLGICIAFDWPSYGNVVDYLPDRAHARECAHLRTNHRVP